METEANKGQNRVEDYIDYIALEGGNQSTVQTEAFVKKKLPHDVKIRGTQPQQFFS